MSNENIERRIEFILEQQAKFSADISQLTEAIGELKDVQKQQGENLISNEVTRKPAEDVARRGVGRIIIHFADY